VPAGTLEQDLVALNVERIGVGLRIPFSHAIRSSGPRSRAC
jgi:hypothetical protein